MKKKWWKLFQLLSVSYFLWMHFKKFMFLFVFSSRCEIWAFLRFFDVVSKVSSSKNYHLLVFSKLRYELFSDMIKGESLINGFNG